MFSLDVERSDPGPSNFERYSFLNTFNRFLTFAEPFELFSTQMLTTSLKPVRCNNRFLPNMINSPKYLNLHVISWSNHRLSIGCLIYGQTYVWCELNQNEVIGVDTRAGHRLLTDIYVLRFIFFKIGLN